MKTFKLSLHLFQHNSTFALNLLWTVFLEETESQKKFNLAKQRALLAYIANANILNTQENSV